MSDAQYAHDVFISHSPADEEWVWGWLLPRLEAAGVSVWTEQSFAPGIPRLQNIERAVATSRRTLLVLSPAWVESEWDCFTGLLVRSEDPVGARRRTIPLLRERCEPPRAIARQVYGDFTDLANCEPEFERLIAVLNGHLHRTAFGPPLGALLGLEAPTNFEYYHNEHFVGRETELATLHELLDDPAPLGVTSAFGDPRSTPRVAGLTGLGGIGKTQLAVEYVLRYWAAYPGGIFWITANKPLAEGLAEIGKVICGDGHDKSQAELVRIAADYMRSDPDTLLVLDNLIEPAELNRPLPGGLVVGKMGCRVLFTTRRRDLGRFRMVEVSVLPEGPALDLLLRAESRRPVLDRSHPEHGEARAICAMLGCLPLALELAGAFLGEWPDESLADFRVRLRDEGCLGTLDEEAQELSAANLPAIHEAAVAATLGTQWAALGDQKARLLLRVAGQLPEAEAIPVERLGLLAGVDAERRQGRPSTLERVLKRLQDACLVQELRAGQVRLHPLVREYAASQTPPREAPSFCRECAARLASAWDDFERLETACATRGVDALQEDLLSALSLLEPENAQPSAIHHQLSSTEEEIAGLLRRLLRVLQREANTLRGWECDAQPELFAQRVQYRAADLGQFTLAERAAGRLAALRDPWLALRWRAASESPALERVLAGHQDLVTAVALTQDGRRAVSGSRDYTLIVWDLDTGQALHTLEGHQGGVTAVALTPDGRRAVSASLAETLIVWDLDTGRALHTLRGHQGRVDAVALTPDGRRAVSASDDHTLIVWDLDTGRALHTLTGYGHWENAVALTPDGRRAVSASRPDTLTVWDLDTGQALHTLRGHRHWVTKVALTADSRRAVSGSWDKTLIVWDLDTGQALHTLQGHQNVVSAVALTQDGRRAVSGSRDYTLIVWDLDTGRVLHTLVGHRGWVNVVALTPDGRRAVSASSDKTLIVWDLDTGRALHTLRGHRHWVTEVALTPDGRRAVSASEDKTLIVWDLAAGRALHTLEGHKGSVRAVALTPDGRRAVSGSRDYTLIVWDLDTGQALASATLETSVTCIAVTSNINPGGTRDGATLIAGDRAGNVYCLELREPRQINS